MSINKKVTSLAAALWFIPATGFGQVTFEQVEAMLVALERSAVQNAGQTPLPDPLTATAPSGSFVESGSVAGSLLTTPPPTNLPSPGQQSGTQGIGGTDFVFHPIDQDTACVANLSQARDEAQALSELARSTEAHLLVLGRRFEALEVRDVALQVDDDLTECPSRFLDAAQDLLGDLTQFDTTIAVQQGETLSVCISGERERIDARMSALLVNTDASSQQMRLELGGVFQRWTEYGEQVVGAVQTLAFLGRRSQRMVSAIEAMQRRCSLFGDY